MWLVRLVEESEKNYVNEYTPLRKIIIFIIDIYYLLLIKIIYLHTKCLYCSVLY